MGELPGGYWDTNGQLHREFELAALNGRDEEELAAATAAQSATVVTEVLSRCVRRIGDISPVSPEVARQLLVADRHYLLLGLRQATFACAVPPQTFLRAVSPSASQEKSTQSETRPLLRRAATRAAI